MDSETWTAFEDAVCALGERKQPIEYVHVLPYLAYSLPIDIGGSHWHSVTIEEPTTACGVRTSVEHTQLLISLAHTWDRPLSRFYEDAGG